MFTIFFTEEALTQNFETSFAMRQLARKEELHRPESSLFASQQPVPPSMATLDFRFGFR